MDDNRLFKWIWRFNALLIAFCAIFAAFVILWEIGLQDIFKTRSAMEVVNLDRSDDTLVETIHISLKDPIKGGESYLLRAQSTQDFASGYSRKSTGNNTVNLATHDPSTGTTTWVFPKNAQLITRTHALLTQTKAPTTQGFLISYVDKDTSGDNRLTRSDNNTLLALSTDATSQKILLTDLKFPPTIQTSQTGTTTLFFTTNTGKFSALYDPITQTLSPPNPINLP